MAGNEKYFHHRVPQPTDGPWRLMRYRYLGLVLVRTLGTRGDAWEFIMVQMDEELDWYGG